MKGASVLETKKNAGRMARLGVLAALLIAAGILVWQNPLSAVPRPTQPFLPRRPFPGAMRGKLRMKRTWRRFKR